MRRKKRSRHVPFLCRSAETQPAPKGNSGQAPASAQAARAAPSKRRRGRCRPVNNRFALSLIAGTLIAAAGMYGLHKLQVHRSADHLRQRAESLLDEGKSAQAAGYLRQYVGLVPDDAKAWLRLCETLEKSARTPDQWLDVFKVSEEALRRDPSHDERRRKQVELALRFGRADAAEYHVAKLLETHSEDGELWFLRGRAYEVAATPDEAAAAYHKAIEHQHRAPDVYARLAGLQRRDLQQPDEAARTLDEMIAANPDSGVAHLLRAESRRDAQNLAGALEDARRARELEPGRLEVQLGAAGLLRTLPELEPQDVTKSLQGLKALVKTHPESVPLHFELAMLARRSGDTEQAEDWFRKGLQIAPKDFNLRVELAALLVDSDRQDKAREQLALLSKCDPPAQFARDELRSRALVRGAQACLEASLLVRQEQWAVAKQKLESAQPDLIGWNDLAERANLQLALCYRRVRDWHRADDAYHRVLSRDPNSAAATLGLAELAAEKGDLSGAWHRYRLATDGNMPPDLQARLSFEAQLRRPPERRDWRETESALAAALDESPDDPDLIILQALVLQAKGDNSGATRVLQNAREQQPTEIRVWVAGAELAARQSDAPGAEVLLDDAEAKFGDRPELRRARIACLMVGGGEFADELQKLETGLEQFTPDQQAHVLADLARAYRALGRSREATKLWQRASRLRPNDFDVLVQYFDAAYESKDDGLIQDAAEQVGRVDGADGPYYRCTEVARAVARAAAGDSSGVESARKTIEELIGERPGWPLVWLWNAKLHELGLPATADDAIAAYRRSLDLGHRHPGVVQRVASLFAARNRWQEADEVIRTYGELPGLYASPTFCRLASLVALRLDDRPSSVRLAGQAIRANPADAESHLWMGRLLIEADQPEQAESSLRRAVELSPIHAEAWTVLVQLLVRGQQLDRATAAVEQAAAHLTTGRNRLALALCYEAIGDRPRATQQVESVLADNPNDVSTQQAAAEYFMRTGQQDLAETAEQLYRDLAASRPETILQLATFLGRQQRTDEALDLCEQALSAEVSSPQVTAAAIGILRSTQPGEEQVARVDSLMTRAHGNQPSSLAARIQVADLRFLQQRYEEAERLYVEILREAPTNVVALNNLAWLMSTQKQDHSEAKRLIQQAVDVIGPVEAVLDTRGTILTNADDFEGAVADFELALEQRNSPKTRFRLAYAQWKLDRRQEAEQNVQQAIADGLQPGDLEPSELPAWQEIAAAFEL